MHGADPVIRLTADCPMIDPAVVDAAIAMYISGDFDYVSNTIKRTYPDGLDVEVVSLAALEEAAIAASHPILREHVTPYITGKRPDLPHGRFRIGHLEYKADFSHVRWTLDTSDDLERLRSLVAQLPDDYTWLQALSIATRQPELLGLVP